MPLFMDLHIIKGITIEEVKKAHIADKAVEEKHNAKLIHFWVNKEAGTVICLLEAPDKESCEAVHQESHGNIACKVEQLDPGYYHLFMGKNHHVDHGMVRHQDGNIDLGYRFIMDVEIRRYVDTNSSGDLNRLSVLLKVKDFVRNHIKKYGGNEVKIGSADNLLAVFMDPKTAVACAEELQRELSEKSSNSEDHEWHIHFKIGVTGGQPLTEKKGFFEEVIRIVQRLSFAADDQEILVSPLVKKMDGLEEPFSDSSIRVLSTSDVKFLHDLFEIIEENIANSHFNVRSLSRAIGVSRSQLYRKTTFVAARPPNTFIRDLRMQKALTLIRKQKYNISEISLKVGITNPSYFSKCFYDKYGIAPSKVHS